MSNLALLALELKHGYAVQQIEELQGELDQLNDAAKLYDLLIESIDEARGDE